MPVPSLAVIVVSYNTCSLTRACLRATFAGLALSPELEATVWVVDNASTDGSPGMVTAEFPQVRLINSQVNRGFAGGNNLALQALGLVTQTVGRTVDGIPAGGWPVSGSLLKIPDLVMLLNSDAEPVGDAIGQMARFLLAHPATGGAGARLRYPDGRFQHGAFRFPGVFQLWFDLFTPRPRRLLESRLNGRYARSAYDSGRPFAVDFVLGAALMARRAAIQAAGPLDEGYFMYAEEVDWCWRMQRAGWHFYCVPTAQVIHHGGASTQQFRARSMVDLWRSRQRLYARFYGPARRWLSSKIVRLGMAIEVRRTLSAHGRGETGAAEADQRCAAARQVAEIFRSGVQGEIK
jgi:N-acetylglucosaminyl-diphospho-decaprenol L-rhamnosyltransferase